MMSGLGVVQTPRIALWSDTVACSSPALSSSDIKVTAKLGDMICIPQIEHRVLMVGCRIVVEAQVS